MVKSISKDYRNTKFPSRCLRQVRKELEKRASKAEELRIYSASINVNETTFTFKSDDDDESDFMHRYDELIDSAYWTIGTLNADVEFRFSYSKFHDWSKTSVEVSLPRPSDIHDVLSILDDASSESIEEFPETDLKPALPVVFLGHGRSQIWRDLRDHLRDHHGYKVEAYETGARAGHTIRDIVEDMATKSNIAFLVHTAEDELKDGSFQTRPNVIHETGLFQGKFGYSRAIVLLEEGCEEFSNLAGIQQIRFSKGSIRETFGDVLATLKREFGEN